MKIDLYDKNKKIKSFAQIREEILETLLNHNDGNIYKTSTQLQVGRSSIYRWVYKPKRFNK